MKPFTTHDIVLVGLFTALTAVGAILRVPLPYVPFTLQVFFVLLAGLVLGSRLGAVSQLVYLIIGLAGVPIFAEGGGPGYIFHPSFGYLVGFIFAAWLMGKMTSGAPGRVQIFCASLVSLAVMYAFGIPYLFLALNEFIGKEVSLINSFKIGLAFLPGDLIKIVLLTLVGPGVLRGIKSHRRFL